jgi:uncharacterized membrane protein YgcG
MRREYSFPLCRSELFKASARNVMQERRETGDPEAEAKEREPSRPRIEVNAVQVGASALAAVTAAFLLSKFGAAGTMIGAAITSFMATVGSAVYTHLFRRTKDQIVDIGTKLPHVVAREQQGPDAYTKEKDVVGEDGDATAVLPVTETEDAGEKPKTDRRTWLIRSAVAGAAVFVVAMIAITLVELGIGKSFSSVTTGGNGGGTSISNPFGGGGSSKQEDHRKDDDTPGTGGSQSPDPQRSDAGGGTGTGSKDPGTSGGADGGGSGHKPDPSTTPSSGGTPSGGPTPSSTPSGGSTGTPKPDPTGTGGSGGGSGGGAGGGDKGDTTGSTGDRQDGAGGTAGSGGAQGADTGQNRVVPHPGGSTP